VSEFDMLHEIAAADECSVQEAACALVENGVVIGFDEWYWLSTKSRAALTAARRSARVADLDDAGQDMLAALAESKIDGGRRAARLQALAAGRGVAEALRKARE
jgi:hypothetical protein